MDVEKQPEPIQNPEDRIIFLADLNKAQPVEGQLCPLCRNGTLEYDGMLVLRCPHCGYHGDGGCFT